MLGRERSLAERLFRAVLLLYPPSLRRSREEDIVSLFVELVNDASDPEVSPSQDRGTERASDRSLGRQWRRWMLVARAMFDVVCSAPGAWAFERREAQRRSRKNSCRRSSRRRNISRFATARGDVVVAVRQIVKNPTFTAVAIVTLALGIGANTAIFSVAYGVLLRPLGLEDPSSLALIQLHRRSDVADVSGFSPGYLHDVKEQLEGSPELTGLTSYVFESVTMTTAGAVEEIGNAVVVDGEFFEVMRVEPRLGRQFAPGDVVPSGLADICLVDETFWQSRLGADPAVIGRSIVLDGRAVEIVGVLPSSVPLPQPRISLWLLGDWDQDDRTLFGRLEVIARAAPSGDFEALGLRLDQAATDLASDHARFKDYTMTSTGLRDALVGDVRPALMVASVVVGLILLIACVNMANLLLVRAAAREREMATRRALGASRSQIVGQLLIESTLLAGLGGVSGVGLAFVLQRLLLALAPVDLPRLDAVHLDLPVLLFAVCASLLTGLLFGIAPVVHSLGLDLRSSIGAGSNSGRARYITIRQGLVVAQVVVAVTLLLGAALMVRSWLELRSVDPGFDVAGIGAARIFLDGNAYPESDNELAYWNQLLLRLDQRSDVSSAGASSGLPMDPITVDYDLPYTLAGDDPDPSGDDVRQAFFRTITPGYLETLRIPLLAGRLFDGRDHGDAVPVAVINKSFARIAWRDSSPVGETFSIYGGRRTLRVVGVVGDVHFGGLRSEFKPEFFVPHTQMTYGAMTVVARSDDSASASRAIASEALGLDPSQPVNSTFSLATLLAASIATDRFLSALLVAFGCVALLLAAAGIYGVISFWVNESRSELGLRMAVGASRRQIVRLVLGRGVVVTCVGLLVGLVLSLAGMRLLAGFLFGVEPMDAVSVTTVVVLLGVTCLVSSLLPAWRAARLDPMRALRRE